MEHGGARFVIAGGSGSLGRRLADFFASDGSEVVILTRSTPKDHDHRHVVWDGRTVGDWSDELDGAVVVNLAGALVDRRPTVRNIELLRQSRVEPTRALVEAAKHASTPPTLWLQMSTLAIYGDAGPHVITESHPPADGPPQMTGVARPWEDAAADAPCERQVIMRTGLVLDAGTPAFDRLARLQAPCHTPFLAWTTWLNLFRTGTQKRSSKRSLRSEQPVPGPCWRRTVS